MNLHVLLDFNGETQQPLRCLFPPRQLPRSCAAGWTAGHRMELLAASGVPVIVNVKVDAHRTPIEPGLTHLQGYPLSTEASWINYHMADAVMAPAELWPALYSESSLLMPCSYHLNGHSVHQGQPPRRINSLMVEGGLDGKGYRCPTAIHEVPWMRT
jgi:hypothetical protein